MKKNTTSNTFLYLTFFMTLCLALFLIPIRTEAASAKEKAFKAYETFLSKEGSSTSYDSIEFAIIYLDKDSVPELVFYKDTVESIYTCENGKMIYVGQGGSTNSGMNYYKKTGVVCAQGTWYESYFLMKNNKLSNYLYVDYNILSTGTKTYYSSSNGSTATTKITKKKFQKKLTKYIGSKKAKTPNYHVNTAANRNKYLK